MNRESVAFVCDVKLWPAQCLLAGLINFSIVLIEAALSLVTPHPEAVMTFGSWRGLCRWSRYPAGHADAGKWFSAAATKGACRLVVIENSYVMKIERKEMDRMLARGFPFDSQLRAGQEYYDAMFAAP